LRFRRVLERMHTFYASQAHVANDFSAEARDVKQALAWESMLARSEVG
jgi:hypothetical protein